MSPEQRESLKQIHKTMEVIGQKQNVSLEEEVINRTNILSSAHRWVQVHGARLYDDALAPLAIGLLVQTTKQEATSRGPAYVFNDGSAIIEDVATGAVLVEHNYESRKEMKKNKDVSKSNVILSFIRDTFGR